MISSILVSNKNRRELLQTALNALAISMFCFAFYCIYNLFSHGVHSPFMTYLFAWPLLLVAVPAGVLYLVEPIPGPSLLTSLFWNTGTAAVTISSLLRGVFEIAGNSSVYQRLMMCAGLVFLFIGAVLYGVGLFMRGRSIHMEP